MPRRRSDASMPSSRCFRDKPLSLGPSPIGKQTFVATITWSRFAYSFSARPVTSSLTPREYMSAVSKKLTPHSSARLTNGLLAASSRVHGCHSGDPYVIMPRQIRETFRPVEPSRTYSIDKKSTTVRRAVASADHEHELSDVLARVHHAMRLRRRPQRERRVNHRRHRARLEERPDMPAQRRGDRALLRNAARP